MDNLSYLFAAYSIIFAAVALYVIFLWRRQTLLDSRLRSLETQLSEIRDGLAKSWPWTFLHHKLCRLLLNRCLVGIFNWWVRAGLELW